MERERQKLIDEILQRAMDLEGEARAQFLDQACAGDVEMRCEVADMLSREADTGEILKHSPMKESRWAVQKRALQTGEKLGHYRIEARIGRGGMGEVWRAWDEQLKREVAIKILPPEFSTDSDRVRRFEQEAFTVSRLNHSNIITIHDVGHVAGEFGDLHFIVTELIEGRTLREILNQSRPGWRDAVFIAAQIAGALNVAHTVGIIHRDIKPENIMVLSDGRVKVLDFGIAKSVSVSPAGGGVDQSIAGLLTGLGEKPGTIKYMSPEQARGDVLDARTDVFSLGLILYEMLAECHPYDVKSPQEIVAALKSDDEIAPLGNAHNRIPAALIQIVTKALRKDRDERYGSAGEMLTDLNYLKSLIKVGDVKNETQLLKEQSADQMLTRFVVFHDANGKTLIPLRQLWTIQRSAGLKRGSLERELIRKSLIGGLIRNGWPALLIVALTLGTAALFSVTEGWEERILRDGHTAAVRQAVFSPDGKLLVSVSEDKRVIVWDFARRERLATLDGHKSEVIAVAFAPDGKRFATMGRDRLVIVWDAARREKIIEWREHQVTDYGIAFSPDCQLLVSVGYLGDLNGAIVRETRHWEKVRELRGVNSPNLLFSPNGRQLMDNQGKVYDLTTGGRTTEGFSDGENWVALAPDAARIAAINSTGEVSVYELARRGDLAQRKLLRRELAHQDHGRAIEFSPDGRLVASGAEHVVLWDAMTLKREAVLEHTSIVWNVAFSPDGRWLVSTHGDGSILVWDLMTRTRAANLNEHSGPARAVAFASDGKRIASASEDQSIIVWNTEIMRKEAVLTGPESRVNGVALSRDGQWLAAADQGKTLVLWDVARREIKWKATDDQAAGYCVAISRDGRWVASTAGVYDRATGRQVVDLHPKENPWGRAYGLAFSADGRRLACATDTGHVLIWDTGRWQLVADSQLAGTHQISVSFAPDGNTLATGEDEGAVRLWRIEPLEQIAVIGQHDARIKSVAFSPDGREVASASDDKTLSLWDVGRRKLIARVGMHTSPVLAVAFSPDGKQLVSGEHDHSVRLYTRRRSLWGWQIE